jgi:alginate O-acetyltransferase complex protein AlgI
MNFTSIDFLLFLSVVFPAFFLTQQRFRNYVILAASCFFYGFWSVKYLFLLLAVMAVDYVVAIQIAANERPATRKGWLLVSLISNLGILFFFKYFNFAMETFADVTSQTVSPWSIILPFGISFYTFHAISYVVDVYRRQIPAERSFVNYSCYVMFFPQLVAGPIARASHLLHQFREKQSIKLQNIIDGGYLIARGFILKLVLADRLAGFVDSQLTDAPNRNEMLVAQAVYFFAFQIYFDFSGYTDIARGVAKLFDFELVKNFERPYFAASITDFWRRWHISLSTWLRDYLYIPLGGNRWGQLLTYRNLMLTMLLGGIWHGAGINFAIWGLLHGAYLSVERAFGDRNWSLALLPRPIKVLLTFHLVCFAWIFFRSGSFPVALDTATLWFRWMSHPTAFKGLEFQQTLWLICLSWLAFEYFEHRLNFVARFRDLRPSLKLAAGYAAIVTVALFAETNPKAFIYFQF